ncbi:MAG: PsbP-related protein [Halobacteriota archaeon]
MDNRNLITALVIAALITLAATAAGCTTNTSPSPTPIPSSQTTNGNNTTFSSGKGFNLTYPTSLKADTTTDPATQVKIYVYLNPNSKIDGVNVGTVDLSAGQTLGSFVDSQMANITKYPNYQETSNNTTTVSGKPAQTIVFQGLVPVQLNTTPTSSTNTTLKVMETFVTNNNIGYVITYKAVPSDYNTYLAQAQRIMSSFVLT